MRRLGLLVLWLGFGLASWDAAAWIWLDERPARQRQSVVEAPDPSGLTTSDDGTGMPPK